MLSHWIIFTPWVDFIMCILLYIPMSCQLQLFHEFWSFYLWESFIILCQIITDSVMPRVQYTSMTSVILVRVILPRLWESLRRWQLSPLRQYLPLHFRHIFLSRTKEATSALVKPGNSSLCIRKSAMQRSWNVKVCQTELNRRLVQLLGLYQAGTGGLGSLYGRYRWHMDRFSSYASPSTALMESQ